MTPSRSRELALDVAVLAMLLVILGFALVPAHRTSIWMDDEFTGFVPPISNRMAAGMVLYGESGHLPIPPLSMVFLNVVSSGEATWLTGSLWNYIFQSAALLLLYVTLAAAAGRSVAFLAVLSGIPFFLALAKTVLYDSFCQFLVAAVMAATLYALGLCRTGDGRPRTRGVVLVGCLVGTSLLVKQSTGMGAALGTIAVLGLFPRDATWRDRGSRLGVFVGSTACSFLLWCLLLSPYMSVWGMIVDVFLTGLEPKGGPRRMLVNLLHYGRQMAYAWPLAAVGLLALVSYARFRKTPPTGTPYTGWFAHAAAAAGVLLAVVEAVTSLWLPIGAVVVILHILMWTGFGLVLLLMLGAFVSPPWRLAGVRGQAMAVLGFIALSAAVFHSLSDIHFRWTYDNNPLILVALAAAFGFLLAAASLPRVLHRILPPLMIVILVASCWVRLIPAMSAALDCSETWPEVAHLTGARLRPSANGMRELVGRVRLLASGAASDTVLLLPGDPNVEEWFERPRPTLSGPMIFADQYWDRYVDEDFAALRENPPKLIIIGPHNYWRRFSEQWHPGWGVERLIDRVSDELLPAHYRLMAEHPITFQGSIDHMDVWLRTGS